MLRRWKEPFEELVNEENKRERGLDGVKIVEEEVRKINNDTVRKP